MTWIPRNCEDLISWGTDNLKGTSLKSHSLQTENDMWIQRNNRIYVGEVKTGANLLRVLKDI